MNTEARLRAVIARVAKVEPDAIGLDDDVRLELGLDSLTILRMAAGIEREFDLTIPDAELVKLTSLRAVLAVVESKSLRHEGPEGREAHEGSQLGLS